MAITYISGSYLSLMTTQLDGITNGTIVAGPSFTSSGNYPFAEIELYVTMATGAPVSVAFTLWLLRNIGGGIEDGGAGVTPAKNPRQTFGVRSAITTAQRIIKEVRIPPGSWTPILKNETGVSAAATGNTLKILPSSYQ